LSLQQASNDTLFWIKNVFLAYIDQLCVLLYDSCVKLRDVSCF